MKGKKKTEAGPFDKLRSLRDDLARRAKQESEAGAKPNKATTSPTHSRPARPPSGDEDEALLLHRMFAGVRPLDRPYERVTSQDIARSASVENLAQRGHEMAAAEAEVVHEHLRALVEGRSHFEVTDDGTRVQGRRADVSNDLVRRLRRGLVPIDSRIDLHGLSVPEARAKVETFLATMRARNERCVLIIHGKGTHSPLGNGVLRGEVTAWLSQSAASQHVAAFATADDHDGGAGATYVLLRS